MTIVLGMRTKKGKKMKKIKKLCAILAFLSFAALASPSTVHAANAADMKNYDAEAKEIFQELTDAFVGIDWIEEEINTYAYPNSVSYNKPEYSCDISARVPFDELSDVDIIIYTWTYEIYRMAIINEYGSEFFDIKKLMGNREEFFEVLCFNSFSGNHDEDLEKAFRKICDFQYDYILAHDNQEYDFTVFIQNDSIKVSDESSGNEPKPSGSREKESEEPSEEILIPSQSLEPSQSSSQESPSNEVKEEDDDRSPWEAVMNKVAGCMLSILILAVAGIALFIVRLKKGKSSRKGD